MPITHTTAVDPGTYPNDPAFPISTTAWNQDHAITGELTLPLVANPATPAADFVNFFGRKVGGRMLVGIEGPSGLDTSLQPLIARNSIVLWTSVAGATAPSALGYTVPTATGTATAAAIATTSRFTRMRKVEYLVTTAATTAVAGFRGATAQWTIGAASAGDGGFFYVCRWGPATGVATTTNRAFCGLANSTAAPSDVEPSTITNIVGMGWDAADTNIQVMHRGTGAITKIDTGIPVPTVDRTTMFDISMFSPPGTTQSVGVEVTNLTTGAVFTTTITTNMPTTTTLLAPRGWMSAGGTSSVIGVGLSSLYIETDY